MEVTFTINGKPYRVTAKTVPIDTSLNTFIRCNAQLSGTKFMCLEGGCGACIVTAQAIHPITKKPKTWAVNSCLTPIFSCHGWHITTVEGVGNRKTGYHQIQKRLAHMNGTQCGYCSPGMVMNMFSLLESKDGEVTMEEVENSFGGNICRCTGYRPILDAFKTFATDADPKLIEACMDIEDLGKTCPKTGSPCAGLCQNGTASNKPINLNFDDNRKWHKVFNLSELFDVLQLIKSTELYMLVAGNTAHGVFRRNPNIQTFIDITEVEELRCNTIESTRIALGANISLTETMELLKEISAKPGFEYCLDVMRHVDLIANVPVRNAGTIAGNLSIKHQHKDFPSDMYILLETIGAKLTIASSLNETTQISIEEFLKFDMSKKIILNVVIPSLDPAIFKFRSYKIMPRAQNAHAYVNAGFLLELHRNKVVSARICFGGIEPNFTHAINTEKLLIGQDLYTNEALQGAVNALRNEIRPDHILPDASPGYRQDLAIALFYKFVLNTCPQGKVKPEYRSGGDVLKRPLSSGRQMFDTFPERYPLTQPVPKYEGLIQCSGELEYINDIPHQPNELWAAFVSATKVHAKLGKIDASEALKIPGVHHFYCAKDIPGENNFSPFGFFGPVIIDEIFLSENGSVLFHGQPVGVILADSFALANSAATKVDIEYITDETKKPIIPTIQHAYRANATELYHNIPVKMVAKSQGENTTKKVRGSMDIGSQYHFTMETQTTVCIPADDGLDVLAASQYVDMTQITIAKALNMPSNAINMVFKRIGGAYGAKSTRCGQIACAAALGCKLTNRPVRFVMTLESNMAVVGKRLALMHDYEVEVDNNGRIQRMMNKFAQDYGCSASDPIGFLTGGAFKNVYNTDTWNTEAKFVLTNSPSSTWTRAPSTTEGIGMIENIMEHIARVTGKDPVDVRLSNMDDDHKMKTMLPEFLKETDYYKRKREVEAFNQQNRWRKRGIAISVMEYTMHYMGEFPVYVAVYHGDGTVAVSHSGIEMGQGINTKVAQVTASTLGVPYESVKIKKMDNVFGANAFCTAGSMSSEVVCYATKRACEVILDRLKPLREELPNAKWAELVQIAYAKSIDLVGSYTFHPTDMKAYSICGVACAEVEIDILTGNLLLNRVDICEDTGESLSPGVDVGQVEGAFVMGLGYWLTESLVYNQSNGELLTNRSWNYKPPGAKDIPIDFRITFLKNSKNEHGFLRSKATGEPPLCLSIVAMFALRHGLESALKDSGTEVQWLELGAPSTPDIIFLNSGNVTKNFKLT